MASFHSSTYNQSRSGQPRPDSSASNSEPPSPHTRRSSTQRVPVSPITQSQWQQPSRQPLSYRPTHPLQTAAPIRDAYGAQLASSPLVSPIMEPSRRESNASDGMSTVSALTTATNAYAPLVATSTNPTLRPNPLPAYVAPAGAAQVVADHRAANPPPPSSDVEDNDGASTIEKEDVQFTDPSLALVNAFLDQLLYSILSSAKSTSLSALRPATIDVLKPRLARAAIANAEEELRELLAGTDEEEEENTKRNSAQGGSKWDLELVWKRTRLRVMVYTRLGEMEDDDEERYIKEDELIHGSTSKDRRFSQSAGLVSWAAAIYLTSVLEFMAELTVQVAGDAAYARSKRQSRSARRSAAEADDVQKRQSRASTQAPVTVEEHDVEKVALNSTLGRLWRTWRKTLRGAPIPMSSSPHQRSFSQANNSENPYGLANSDLTAPATRWSHMPSSGAYRDANDPRYPEQTVGNRSMGLPSSHIADAQGLGIERDPFSGTPGTRRRNSFTIPTMRPQTIWGLPTNDTNASPLATADRRPVLSRTRSNSLPTKPPMPGTLLSNETSNMPGAFPAGEEQKPVVAAWSEQKANADEMRPLKRLSTANLLQHEENRDVTAETGEASASKGDGDSSNNHGVLGGAVAAGVAAVAAGGAALVYGSNHKDGEKSDEANISAPLSGVDGAADPSGEAKAVQIMTSRKVSVSSPATPPTLVRTGSGVSRNSYSMLDDDDPQKTRMRSLARQYSGGTAIDRELEKIKTGREGSTSAPTSPLDRSNDAFGDGAKWPTPNRMSGGRPSTSGNDGIQSAGVAQNPGQLPGHSALSPSTLDYVLPEGVQPGQNATERSPRKRASVPGIALSANTAAQSSAPVPVPTTSRVQKAQNRQSWSAFQPSRGSERNSTSSFNGRPLSSAAVLPSSRFSTLLPQLKSPRENSDFGDKLHPSVSTDAPEVMPHPAAQKMMNRLSMDPDSPALTSANIRGPEDFEAFVQGGETVKYTLTPDAVREEISQAQVHASSMPGQAVELPGAPAHMATTRQAPAESRSGRSPISKLTTSTISATGRPVNKNPPVVNRTNNRSDSHSTNGARSGLLARDARIVPESTRDFADFIRSTGPQRAMQPQPILSSTNRSASNLQAMRNAHINGSRADSIERSRSMGRDSPSTTTENIPPMPANPNVTAANKPRKMAMEPRSPTASSSGIANAELIDFIRNGPSAGPGEHRISRTVAPFRTTMDSDQLGEYGDRINGSSPSDLSGARSPTGTTASRTERNVAGAHQALTNGAVTDVHPPRHSSMAPVSPLLPDTADPQPQRKRHRNKDPYAIDYSDEDDEDADLLSALPRNRRQELSLIDFLNSTEPPSNNAPRPIVNSPGAVGPLLKNMGSRELLGQTNGDPAASSNEAPTAPVVAVAPSQSAPAVQPPADSQPRQPTMDNPGPPPEPPASSPLAAAPAPGVPKSKMEARMPGFAHERHKAAAEQSATTRELADFLKSTAPNDNNSSAPAPIVTSRRPETSAGDGKRIKKTASRRFMGRGNNPANSSAASMTSHASSTKRSGLGGFFGLRKWRTGGVVETSS